MTPNLLDRHRLLLDAACAAWRSREAFTPFQESASRRHHPDGAPAAGRAAFEARLHRPFDLNQPGAPAALGAETSPYTGEPLGVRYPRATPDDLIAAALKAWPAWRAAPLEGRVGLGLQLLRRLEAQSFELAHATMHTTGQAFPLAFAGSGASSLERGLEGLTAAWLAQRDVPARATYTRRFGGAPVTLDKRYRTVPVGLAVVFACGSYPAWNAWPALLANLVCGNPVILKPHPDTLLPVAIGVETTRQLLAEAGFDPNLVTLAADTWDAPIGRHLVEDPAVAIVDFTGGQAFGRWLETHLPGKQIYTETAGCNAVLLESSPDLDATLDAIAHGLALFSAQMCTAPQNLWVPATGVLDGDRRVLPGELGERLTARLDALLADPAHAAALCGALHSERTRADLATLAASGHPILRPGGPYAHPDFPKARTATPLLVALAAEDRALAQREHFGPMAFLITAPDPEAALAGATADAARFGAIASYAYATDPARQEAIADAFVAAGASLGLNLHRQRPINFTAGFSDYHVTGLNPAGNASLTDLAFVARRFRVVQTKTERPAPPPAPTQEP